MKIELLEDILSFSEVRKLEKILPASRIAYAQRYYRYEDRLRSLAAGVLFVYALREVVEDKEKIKKCIKQIEWGGGKKPVIPEFEIEFNLSHSGKYAVCVLGEDACGIDIQKKKKNVDFLKGFFSEKEWEWIMMEPYHRAIRLWTMKESYGKYLGTGLSAKMPELSAYLSDANELQFMYCDSSDKCRFQEYEIDSEYAVAICTKEVLPDFIKKVENADLEKMF